MDSEQKWYKVIRRDDDLRGPSASPQQYKDPSISAEAAQCYTPLLRKEAHVQQWKYAESSNLFPKKQETNSDSTQKWVNEYNSDY